MFKPKDLMKPESDVNAGASQRDDYGLEAVQPYLRPMWEQVMNTSGETLGGKGKGKSKKKK